MGDVREMHALLQHFAGKGLLLARSISSLYDQLRDFVVYDDNGIHGVCALHICWEDLAEIRSLAVSEDTQGTGVGEALVQACLLEARRLDIGRVFTLTYQGPFFQKLNFKEIDLSRLSNYPDFLVDYHYCNKSLGGKFWVYAKTGGVLD